VTGTSEARSPRWEKTHQRIYDVALELFQRDGFDNVTVAQIAKGAKITVPTFYAHYTSKEHIVMQLPTAEAMTALLATQPSSLPIGERIRRMAPLWLAHWTPEFRAAELVRWRVIATTPSLRMRAAEFERATAGMVAQALTPQPDGTHGPAEQTVINAHLAAFTVGVLTWADGNGERRLEDVVDEAFAALHEADPGA
jgi:AcrR family transcriptional regulator